MRVLLRIWCHKCNGAVGEYVDDGGMHRIIGVSEEYVSPDPGDRRILSTRPGDAEHVKMVLQCPRCPVVLRHPLEDWTHALDALEALSEVRGDQSVDTLELDAILNRAKTHRGG